MQRVSGRSEPLHLRSLPSFRVRKWPPSLFQGCKAAFVDFLRRSFAIDPEERVSASGSWKHELLLPCLLRTVISAAPAGQGAASVQTKQLDPLLLSWLQAAFLARLCAA